MAVVEVIKYSGSPDVFAWKHPNSELGTWTQLIVNESQEAVLFKGGQALDVFQSGRHTLDTKNIPLLNKIINLPFGGRSPFAAEIWYINKAYNLDIKWGTPTPIQIQDPKFGVFVPVRTFGQFGMKIDEAKKFLVKLVGTLSVFDSDSITNYFRGLYVSKVKDSISAYLIKKEIGTLEINAYISELSNHIKETMQPVFDEYGITLVNFYIKNISIPEDDPSVIQLKDALAKRAEMNIVGYNYQQQRSFDTLDSELGARPRRFFAYVGGDYSRETYDAAREAGIDLQFVQVRHFDAPGLVYRVNVEYTADIAAVLEMDMWNK